MEQFYINSDDFLWSVNTSTDQSTENRSRFDHFLQSNWKTAAEAGVCRYQLTALQTKILPGQFKFVAQVRYVTKTTGKTLVVKYY